MARVRIALPVLATLFFVVLTGCGAGGESTDGRRSQAEYEMLVGPEIDLPDGPPPEKLVTKDRKTGLGPVAQRGDRVGINYVGVYYETGEKLGRRWLAYPPAVFRLGHGSYSRGVERGIEGMRVGGQREIIIPARLGPNSDPMIYVVALDSVEQAGGAR